MKYLIKYNESRVDRTIWVTLQQSIKGIDIKKARDLISYWEKSKGNTKYRDIEFLRWYEENIEFDPIISKEINSETEGHWSMIPLCEIYDYFIEFVDDYDVSIYIAKGATSKDTYLTLEFLTDDPNFLDLKHEMSLKIIKMAESLGQMYDKKIKLYDHFVENDFRVGREKKSIVYFYFNCPSYKSNQSNIL
jgi:predicted nucleotidyltransferase